MWSSLPDKQLYEALLSAADEHSLLICRVRAGFMVGANGKRRRQFSGYLPRVMLGRAWEDVAQDVMQWVDENAAHYIPEEFQGYLVIAAKWTDSSRPFFSSVEIIDMEERVSWKVSAAVA